MQIQTVWIWQRNYLRKAQEAGVTIMINTDAHNIDMLEHMEIGVAAAKKGWIEKDNLFLTQGILNVY